jgi:hypothetical protein
MSTITPNDLGRLPPIDKTGELKEAIKTLDYCRKKMSVHSPEWQGYISDCIAASTRAIVEKDGGAKS